MSSSSTPSQQRHYLTDRAVVVAASSSPRTEKDVDDADDADDEPAPFSDLVIESFTLDDEKVSDDYGVGRPTHIAAACSPEGNSQHPREAREEDVVAGRIREEKEGEDIATARRPKKLRRRCQSGKGPSRGMNIEERLMLIVYAVVTLFLWLHIFLILPFCQVHWEDETYTDNPSPPLCQSYYGSSTRGRHHAVFFVVVAALYALSLAVAYLSPVQRHLAYSPLMLSARDYASRYALSTPSIKLHAEVYEVDRCCGLCAYQKKRTFDRTEDISASFSRVYDDTITLPAVDSFTFSTAAGDDDEVQPVEWSRCCGISRSPCLIRLRTFRRHVECLPAAEDVMNEKKRSTMWYRGEPTPIVDAVGGEGFLHRENTGVITPSPSALYPDGAGGGNIGSSDLEEDYHLAYATDMDTALAPGWSSCLASWWIMWFFAVLTLGPLHHAYFYLRTVSLDIDVVKIVDVNSDNNTCSA